MNKFYKIVWFSFAISGTVVWTQFFECYHDGGYDPDEGPVNDLRFSWLGVLQYIHMKNGTPHYYRAPRVILIAKQFVLSTATDASAVPTGYALGNVVFGDYERDEEECKLSIEELAVGADCEPAVLIMPIADVLLHPEYKHFHAKHSIALLKLITAVSSNYVVPACLPFKDFVVDRRNGKMKLQKLYYVDYTVDTPRDFVDEEKEVQKLNMLPRELCVLYDYPEKAPTAFTKDRMGCSTGCGLHSGAPSLVHEHTGHWSLVALAVGRHRAYARSTALLTPDPVRAVTYKFFVRVLQHECREIVSSVLDETILPWLAEHVQNCVLGFHPRSMFGFQSTLTTVSYVPKPKKTDVRRQAKASNN